MKFKIIYILITALVSFHINLSHVRFRDFLIGSGISFLCFVALWFLFRNIKKARNINLGLRIFGVLLSISVIGVAAIVVSFAGYSDYDINNIGRNPITNKVNVYYGFRPPWFIQEVSEQEARVALKKICEDRVVDLKLYKKNCEIFDDPKTAIYTKFDGDDKKNNPSGITPTEEYFKQIKAEQLLHPAIATNIQGEFFGFINSIEEIDGELVIDINEHNYQGCDEDEMGKDKCIHGYVFIDKEDEYKNYFKLSRTASVMLYVDPTKGGERYKMTLQQFLDPQIQSTHKRTPFYFTGGGKKGMVEIREQFVP